MSSILNIPWLRSRRTRTVLAAAFAGALVALVLLSPQFADANPDDSVGDHLIFAKAAGDGSTSDPKAFEPVARTRTTLRAGAWRTNRTCRTIEPASFGAVVACSYRRTYT